ncbi:unnamed protein product [Urochloa humidicola]
MHTVLFLLSPSNSPVAPSISDLQKKNNRTRRRRRRPRHRIAPPLTPPPTSTPGGTAAKTASGVPLPKSTPGVPLPKSAPGVSLSKSARNPFAPPQPASVGSEKEGARILVTTFAYKECDVKVSLKEYAKFQGSYATVLKAHMHDLKKRERKDRKKAADAEKVPETAPKKQKTKSKKKSSGSKS